LFKSSKVILLSENLHKDISKYVAKKDVFFCPNGAPVIDDTAPITIENETPQILFLSNLIESKGVFVLLEALRILKQKGVCFFCNLVGGEGDISNHILSDKVNKLELTDVIKYHGKKYGRDKLNLFNQADLFVFPTFYHNECFPLVLLEAMMCGLPVISTNEGGISDIVKHNKTGFIVEKQNPTQLAEKMEWLIKNPQLAKKMGKEGQNQYNKKFTLERFENRFVEILNSVV
jgi:glycosyltransferase involved in cell wall biosynthesis